MEDIPNFVAAKNDILVKLYRFVLAALLTLALAAAVHAQSPRYVVIDLGGGTSWGSGINNAGQVAGGYIAGGITHAALFEAGTAPVDLTPISNRSSDGVSINDAGYVGGYFTTAEQLYPRGPV